MKTKEEIEIDFSRAISQAQELEQIAQELSNIANAHLEGAFAMLRNSWKGDNQTVFDQKGETITNEMYDTADEMIRVAKSIRTTADIVYRAEKSALAICY